MEKRLLQTKDFSVGEDAVCIRHIDNSTRHCNGVPYIPDRYQVEICLAGEATVSINGETFNVSERKVNILCPDDTVEGISYGEDFEALSISFSPAFYATLHASSYGAFKFIGDRSSFYEFNEKCLMIINEYIALAHEIEYNCIDNLSRPSLCHLTLCLYFMLLSSENGKLLSRQYSCSYSNNRVNGFFEIARKKYTTNHTISYYSKELGMTDRHLNRLLKIHTGKTARQILAELLTRRAKALLRSSSNTIKSISDELGFSDQIVFTTFFKKQSGMTPSAYRNATPKK